MAITRRQFVTRLGTLAAAMGIGQMDLARVTEAFAYGNAFGAGVKPKVIWVHGAECTGCSTSLLGLFEHASGRAIQAVDSAGTWGSVTTTSTIAALGLATAPDLVTRTLQANGFNVDGNASVINIADILIDIIDLQYHETVQGQVGDVAYNYLKDAMTGAGTFVLVVEGAVQPSDHGGYWNKTGDAAWCSIAMDGARETETELKFDAVVADLALEAAAVIAIGQCATYGGYPACAGPDLQPPAIAANGKNQTSAMGVNDFLTHRGGAYATAANKVINVPGCPTNPWWFILTVVAWLIDANSALSSGTQTDGPLGILFAGGEINPTCVDTQRRLKAVYGSLLHGKYCPRYAQYAQRHYANKPGEDGCLKNIGCKGLSTMSLCSRHGWNAQQPTNAVPLTGAANHLDAPAESCLYNGTGTGTKAGGMCITAGAPCMGCTEKGYPDAFVPYVVR
jgi:hydrogenase small subunit